ncbi:MAG: shikimate kinase AroK [Pseudomonadota bacterium]
MAPRRLFLVGLMAVGKTTVGRLLSQALDWEFVDTDQLIEARAGADIPWIFDVEGEDGFRDRETAVLAEVADRDNLVIATGGGVVLREENRDVLRRAGTVVFLDSTVERLLERTRRDSKRPLLKGVDRRAVLTRLHAERGPLYHSVADYRFTTDRQGPKILARRIEQRLRQDGLFELLVTDDA